MTHLSFIIALVLSFVSESKAMDQMQPLVHQQQNQLAFIQDGHLHFKGEQYLIDQKIFDFDNIQINNAEAQQLFPLFNQLPNLTSLDFINCGLGNNEITYISNDVLARIRFLDLSQNNIDDAGAIALANRPLLLRGPMSPGSMYQGKTMLFLNENIISPNGISDLEDIFENIGVISLEDGRQRYTQHLVNQMQANYAHIQAPVNLSYADFSDFLVVNFLTGVEEVEHGGFTIVPSLTTQMDHIGSQIVGLETYNTQMSQLNQNVIFTSGFQDATAIANLPEGFRNNDYKAASFIYPVPANYEDNKNYPQTNYEFFVAQYQGNGEEPKLKKKIKIQKTYKKKQ